MRQAECGQLFRKGADLVSHTKTCEKCAEIGKRRWNLIMGVNEEKEKPKKAGWASESSMLDGM